MTSAKSLFRPMDNAKLMAARQVQCDLQQQSESCLRNPPLCAKLQKQIAARGNPKCRSQKGIHLSNTVPWLSLHGHVKMVWTLDKKSIRGIAKLMVVRYDWCASAGASYR